MNLKKKNLPTLESREASTWNPKKKNLVSEFNPLLSVFKKYKAV